MLCTTRSTVSDYVAYHFVADRVLLLIPCFAYWLSVFVDHTIHTDIQFIILLAHTYTNKPCSLRVPHGIGSILPDRISSRSTKLFLPIRVFNVFYAIYLTFHLWPIHVDARTSYHAFWYHTVLLDHQQPKPILFDHQINTKNCFRARNKFQISILNCPANRSPP